MKTFESNSSAAMKFELNWQSAEPRHSELFYAPNANMWRDIFPAEVENQILGARENETFTFAFKPGVVVPKFSSRNVLDLSPTHGKLPTGSAGYLCPAAGC